MKPAPDAEERFLQAIGHEAHELLVGEGHELMFEDRIEAVAEEVGVSDYVALHVLGSLESRGLIWREGRTFKVMPLAALYEQNFDREGFRQRNVLRRKALASAARAFEAGNPWVGYWQDGDAAPEDEESFTNAPYAEASWGIKLLEHEGLVEVRSFLGRHFEFKITPDGYSLARDETSLRATLPTSASEDEAAHAAVAPDALQSVIRSCEEMLDARGWASARDELSRGDDQYRHSHWVGAVREYYAALESGLQYRLDEAQVSYAPTDSLKALARAAADAALIPVNYQAAFGFLDSIRSPRSHGRGSRPAEVPVGPAEALLAGNQARALLLYLGHLP